MSEFKSDWALQNPYTLGEKNQVRFAFPVLVVVGVGMKTCELRINMKSDNVVFQSRTCNYRLNNSVLLVLFGDWMIDLVVWCFVLF